MWYFLPVGHGRYLAGLPSHMGSVVQLKAVGPKEVPRLVLNYFKHTHTQSHTQQVKSKTINILNVCSVPRTRCCCFLAVLPQLLLV